MNLKLKLKHFFIWFKSFIRGNPGALPILGFQGLLIACAVLLVFGMDETADSLAVIAYFLLVAGVLVQLAYYIWESHRGGKNY
ncbi:MAG: hypothetical protein QXR89_06655 [Candidatus Bathyarchaeia archaeon]